jgi:ABC-type bacteriocin/lantibiotic exporter with double-glycine peptidase domain
MFAQEHSMSCGTACVRQLLADSGQHWTEAQLYQATGFDPKEGTRAILLEHALNQFNPLQEYQHGTIDDDQLGALLGRVPFIAMVGHHWIIVDGVTASGALKVRDPAPFSTLPSTGTEGTVDRAAFVTSWNFAGNQVVLRRF